MIDPIRALSLAFLAFVLAACARSVDLDAHGDASTETFSDSRLEASQHGDANNVASTLCDGDVDASPLHCGAACVVCALPEHGQARCANGACTPQCDPGYVLRGAACVLPPAPRPIYPISNSYVTVAGPMLRWALPDGVGGAHLTVCSDRACLRVIVEFDVMGDHVTFPPMARGTWYWNLRSITLGIRGTAASPTWQLHSPPRARDVSTAWARYPDFDGDGFDDLAIGALSTSGSTPVTVYRGGAMLSQPGAAIESHVGAGVGAQPFVAGDVNGDGFSDLLVATTLPGGQTALELFGGGPMGINPTPISTAVPSASSSVPRPRSRAISGDLDGDGYSDVIASMSSGTSMELQWARGGPTGLAPFRPITRDTQLAATVGDFDADGVDDVLVVSCHGGGWYAQLFQGSLGGPAMTGFLIDSAGLVDAAEIDTVGDTDGDGYLDAAFTTSGPAWLHVIRGGTHIDDGIDFMGASSLTGGIGDADSDGLDDMATRGARGFEIYYGGGVVSVSRHASFDPPSLGANPSAPPAAFTAIGDFNGDGVRDSVVAEPSFSPNGRVLLFNGFIGDGSSVTPVELTGTTSMFGAVAMWRMHRGIHVRL